MRVISASRRTDIPAFYSRWLLNRIRAGFCHWLNPFASQVYRVSLAPEDCLALVFWTRNPQPLLAHLDFLRREGFRFYFQLTITGYPRPIESHTPPLEEAIASFRRLSQLVGPERVFWRYDPILLGDLTPERYHVERFDRISGELAGYTRRCYFSFVDLYGKAVRNLGKAGREHGVALVGQPAPDARLDLVRRLRDLAARRDITLHACCEPALAVDGIQRAHCVDADVVQTLWADAAPDSRPALALRAAPTRKGCGCVESADVGAYDTCVFGCAYCYATNSREAALARLRAHDPDDSILCRPESLRGVDLQSIERPLGGVASPDPGLFA